MTGTMLLGMLGFLLYFMYDINSIYWNNRFLQKFFAIGSICVVISTGWHLYDSFQSGIANPMICLLFAAGSLFFLSLLIYTLFFALPFETTYVQDNSARLAYTDGVYALCRHPGVLWFAGAYICLWGMTGDCFRGFFFLSMILFNWLYIIFQDVWTFPKTFTNYQQYKQTTPFLLPNVGSIKACFTRKSKVDRI